MELELGGIASAVGAASLRRGARIQSLWGGYGELFRVHATGAPWESAVVKWAKPPAKARESAASDRRKRRSYDVELAWYRAYAPRCDASCRVPSLLAGKAEGGEWVLVLEDLDAAGFPGRRRRDLGPSELAACLGWLAALHARFLGEAPAGLWETGTYWHLATRSSELAVLGDPTSFSDRAARADARALAEAAPLLDRLLREARFQTVVHGDAKPANYCFAEPGGGVAAVDFQYAGRGVGVRDVAYLLSGASPSGAEAFDPAWLDAYFARFREALASHGDGRVRLAGAIEDEWRALYPVAHADFTRFFGGWAPGPFEADAPARRFARRALERLRASAAPP